MTYIYFIQAGIGGPVKIGYAVDLKKRLNQLQVGNAIELTLLGAYPGGRLEEANLQQQFKSSLVRGEWYVDTPELQEVINQHPLPDHVPKTRKRAEQTGANKPNWRGTSARRETKNARFRRRFVISEDTLCESCRIAKAVDRKCKDGNYENLQRSNVLFLCRTCRMQADGTLDSLKKIAKTAHYVAPPRPCANCQTLAKPLRKGLCHNCNEYFRRNQKHRPKQACSTP